MDKVGPALEKTSAERNTARKELEKALSALDETKAGLLACQAELIAVLKERDNLKNLNAKNLAEMKAATKAMVELEKAKVELEKAKVRAEKAQVRGLEATSRAEKAKLRAEKKNQQTQENTKKLQDRLMRMKKRKETADRRAERYRAKLVEQGKFSFWYWFLV